MGTRPRTLRALQPETLESSSAHQWAGPTHSKPALASESESPTHREQVQDKHSPAACQPNHQPASTSHGTGWALDVPTNRPTQALRHPRPCSHLFQEPAPQTSAQTQALGSLGHSARPQDLALPASGLALAPLLGLSHQWADTSPRISWTPTSPITSPRVPPHEPTLPTSSPQPPHKAGPGNQPDQGPTMPTRPPIIVRPPQQKDPHSLHKGHA